MKTKILVSIIVLLTSAACASTKQQQLNYSYNIPSLSQSTNSYLAQAAQASDNSQIQYQLLAATSMLQNGEINAATQELNKITASQLQGSQLSYFYTLQAYLALASDQPYVAAIKISKVSQVN